MLYEYYYLNEGTDQSDYTNVIRDTLASLEDWQRPGVCYLVLLMINLQLTVGLNLFTGNKLAIVDKEEARRAGLQDVLATSQGVAHDLHGRSGWIERFSVLTVDRPF